MAKIKYGQTVAGKRWFESLDENFGMDGRFARGKSYFSKGLVKKFLIDGSKVHAKVKGSYGTYETYFSFHLESDTQEKIKNYFKNSPLMQAGILNGELGESFFEWAEEEGAQLFISLTRVSGRFVFRDTNYTAQCNCYDFYDAASPCKHILALWFALSQEIDHNPLILLKLHGIEPEELLDTDALNHEIPYPIEILFEEKDEKNLQNTNHPIEIVHFEDNLAFFFSLMPSNPPFAPLDYKEVLREFYKAHMQRLPQLIAPIYSEEISKIERIFKEAKIEIITDKLLRNNKAIIKHPLFKQEATLYKLFQPYILEANSQVWTISIVNFKRLFLKHIWDKKIFGKSPIYECAKGCYGNNLKKSKPIKHRFWFECCCYKSILRIGI